MALLKSNNSESQTNASDASAQGLNVPVVLHTRVVSGQGGGPEKTILNSPRFLTELGYRGVCAYMHPSGDPGFDVLRSRAEDANAPLISIPDRGIRDWRVFRRMLDICRSENVSIWHGHDYKSNFIGLMLRRFHPMQLITTVHGWVKFTKKTPLYYWIDKRCLRKYDRVLCVSDDLYDACLDSGVSPKKCQVVYNGIDTLQNRRTLPADGAKTQLGFPADRFTIGAVGRLSAEKGFDVLIHSVGRLIAAGHNLQLLIAGEGDDRPRLEALIQSQSDPGRFQLLGHRNDIPELFQAMDAFALSSLREGLPNVLLEAMAFEVPVVATRIAGVPRVVQDGENGLLVEPGQQDALTAALQRLLREPELRPRFAREGRQTIEQNFSFERRMQHVAAIYDELLGRTNAPEAVQ